MREAETGFRAFATTHSAHVVCYISIMADAFQPHLEILPSPQRRLWTELAAQPFALQVGHRSSIDFDFFSNEDLNANCLLLNFPFLGREVVTQRASNTLSCVMASLYPCACETLRPLKPIPLDSVSCFLA